MLLNLLSVCFVLGFFFPFSKDKASLFISVQLKSTAGNNEPHLLLPIMLVGVHLIDFVTCL